jgi:Zn-finger protein
MGWVNDAMVLVYSEVDEVMEEIGKCTYYPCHVRNVCVFPSSTVLQLLMKRR